VGYPVRGWKVEQVAGNGRAAGMPLPDTEAAMAALLAGLAGRLQAADQPFNLLLVDGGRAAFVWPQCYAERQAAGEVPEVMLDTGVNPAVFEVAGHLILKRATDFAMATDAWAASLLAGVSLDAARFGALTRDALCNPEVVAAAAAVAAAQ
jgi:GDP-L-galactose phosphorylase